MAEGAAAGLRQRLEREVLLLDGGLGSLFIAMGLQNGQAPEWWVVEHPERITEVHRQYVEAGSDVIQTCTFGGSAPKLEDAKLAGRCAEINARAVELARAAGGDALVAGDVGPSGKLFPPMGDATVEQLEQAFTEQAQALCRAGADLITIETMYDLREALAATRAAAATGLPVFASMTFDAKKRGFFTIVGDRIDASMQALVQAGATAVGLNCTVGSDAMIPMVKQAVAAVDAPVVAQPNAGAPRVTPQGVIYDVDPTAFCADLLAMVDAGARVVGGCCGSTPEIIRLARTALDERK